MTPERTLSTLFLTLFLRGRGARGLKKSTAPTTVARKLLLTLVFYAAFGLIALALVEQPVLALSTYLHSMTFIFLGMFVAMSAGEVLFNKEEADILMHRPIAPRALLRAKISILVQVSLWLAGAFNIGGFIIGVFASNGGWTYPLVHAASTAFEALFCTSCIVMAYQLCLRWFGRERLDGVMTAVQVLVSITFVLGANLVPQLLTRYPGALHLKLDTWWVVLLPPAWFAGFDDALAGTGARNSFTLGAFGIAATVVVLWLAFGRLAEDYQRGLQMIGESSSAPRARGRRRWMNVLVSMPPLSWWLRDSVARASFLLSAAYLVRDRDVKLRVYPGLVPMIVLPVILLLPGRHGGIGGGGFGVAFTGCYLAIVPLLGLTMLEFSQQWAAADLFRLAPIAGPGSLCHGARRAILLVIAVPAFVIFTAIAWLMSGNSANLPLLLPGIIALPVYALMPCLNGKSVPLSRPIDESKSANRSVAMFGAMFASFALAGVALLAWNQGWFKWLLLVETVLAVSLYLSMRASIDRAVWAPIE